jgi:hypothetical protein
MYNIYVKKITLILFLPLVFCIGFLPVKDPDFGWHYRCGNQFLTTGKLCLSNEFSYYLSDYKAYYSGHLYDILLAFIYNHGGFIAISIAGALVYVLSAYFFTKLISQENLIKFISFIVIFFLSISIFGLGLRPQIISYCLTLLLLYILQQKNKKIFYLLPVLFLFWVNIHIGFFIGLIILVFYCINDILLLLDDRPRVIISKLFPLLILFLSFIATLINPFGINVYTEILNHAFAPLGNMIAEWTQPALWQKLLIILFSILLIFVMIKNKSKSIFNFLLILFFSVLAFKGVRNLPYFYTYFFYIISHNHFSNDRDMNGNKSYSIIIPILISLIIFFSLIQIPQTVSFDTNWEEICNTTTITPYPCIALKKYPQLSGNVFANYEWGGFLIWQKLNIKVFVDGRMSAWKAPDNTYPYQTYLEIIQTKNNWNEKLKKLKTDYLLIGTGTYLDLLLQKEHIKYQWEEKYQDKDVVIYKKID